MRTFKRGQESYGHADGLSHLCERVSTLQSQAPQSWPDGIRFWLGAAGLREESLRFEHVNNGRSVHSASATEELGALEQTHVGLGVKTVLAARASGRNEAESLPRTKYRRRYSDEARHIADAQIARSALDFAGQLKSVSQTSFLLTSLRSSSNVREL